MRQSIRSTLQRRQWLQQAALWATAPLAVLTLAKAQSSEPRVVQVVAQKFRYTPREIMAKPGEALLLEVRSLDFVHGLSIPDLKLRADLPPGRVTQLRVKFDKAGRYDFLCDNFCGNEHEEMGGQFVIG